MTTQTVLSSVLELLGLAAIVAGVAMFSVPVAFVVAGVFLVFLGYATDPPAPRHPSDGAGTE